MNKNQEIKNFIVVGAGSPVGMAISQRVISTNPEYRLMMTTRKDYEACADIFHKNNNRVQYLSDMDLSDRKKLEEFRQNVADFTGDEPYAVVMSTSYFPEHKPFIETPFEEKDEIWKANLEVPRDIMFSLIPHMLDHKGGHFIGFSCQSTRYHYPFMADFTATKDALDGYMETLANEHGGHGIKFNNAKLASVQTNFTVNSKPNGDTENYITPDEVSKKVMGMIIHKESAQNGESQWAYKHSPIDHSFKNWAGRILTDKNGQFIHAFLGWTLQKNEKFPRMSDFIPKPKP